MFLFWIITCQLTAIIKPLQKDFWKNERLDHKPIQNDFRSSNLTLHDDIRVSFTAEMAIFYPAGRSLWYGSLKSKSGNMLCTSHLVAEFVKEHLLKAHYEQIVILNLMTIKRHPNLPFLKNSYTLVEETILDINT